jgi:hypothetical protein
MCPHTTKYLASSYQCTYASSCYYISSVLILVDICAQTCDAEIQLPEAACVEVYKSFPQLGRFVLREDGATVLIYVSPVSLYMCSQWLYIRVLCVVMCVLSVVLYVSSALCMCRYLCPRCQLRPFMLHIYIRIYICMYVCMYVCMYIHMYVCMYI